MSYSIHVCRTGWLVFKGDERRFPEASGFATKEQAEDWVWDTQNREARDEFRKVSASLPVDTSAHPFSGRRGEY